MSTSKLLRPMIRFTSFALLIGSSLLLVAGANAAPPPQAGACAGCHGQNGISFGEDIPNLAGQKKAYLVKAINDYISGRRKNGMMNSMVANLSASDVEALSKYYSELK